MSISVLHATPVSQTETMIRNLQAAGFSEDDIHYEMSGYGSVPTFTRLLGYDQAADVLPETRNHEGSAG
jgi:ferritin-like metal-binding protein YciE